MLAPPDSSICTGLATEESDVGLNVDQIVGLEQEQGEDYDEESEEEANKENISPEGIHDVCRDMDYFLSASPILQEDHEDQENQEAYEVGFYNIL